MAPHYRRCLAGRRVVPTSLALAVRVGAAEQESQPRPLMNDAVSTVVKFSQGYNDSLI